MLYLLPLLSIALGASNLTTSDYAKLIELRHNGLHTEQALRHMAALYLKAEHWTHPSASEAPSTRTEPSLRNQKFIWPVSGKFLIRYGSSILDSPFSYHHVLIQTGNTYIQASASGTVQYAQSIPHVGLTVILEHEGHVQSIYSQCDRLHVREGDHVTQGQVIAEFMGPKPHALLFSTKRKGSWINPNTLITRPLRKKG